MSFLAALLFSLLIHTADDLTLSGTVTDAGGSGVAEAQVILEHTTDRRQWQFVSTETGTFRFDRLPIGSYVLRVVKEGYFPLAVDIGLEASKYVEITLATMETAHEEVDVVARPQPINTESVAAEQNVNNQVVQNLPYTGRLNFLNALSLMPGVLQDNDGGMHIHGSRTDQIRYQLDGLNITDPSGGLASNIPIDAVESVDLDLSGYSAEFGKGSGGVVRVESKFIGDKLKWDLTDFIPGVNFRRKTLSDFSPRFLLSGPLVRNKAWFMYAGTLKYVRTFNEDLPEGQNRQNQTNADQLVKLQWNLGESHVLTMSLLNNSEYYGNLGLSLSRPLESTTNMLRRSTTAAVSNRNLVRGTLFETTAQWTHRRDSDLAKGTQPLIVYPTIWTGNFNTDQRGRTDRFHAGQTVALERQWGGMTHRIKTGGEFDYVISDLTVTRRPFKLVDNSGSVQLDIRFQGPDYAEVRNREIGFFLQDRIVLSRKLQVELGVRADRESVVGALNFAPRLAFSFLPTGSDTSKVSGGIGVFYDNVPLDNFQFARMQRRITTSYENGVEDMLAPNAIGISPNLSSPYGIHWNAEWDREWVPRWVSRIGFLQKRGKHQVRLASTPSPGGFDLVFNSSGKSSYDAIELSLDRPIRSNLRVLGSYTYSQSKGRPSLSMDLPDPALDRMNIAPLDWDARHRFLAWGYFPFFWQTSAAFAVDTRTGFPFSTMDQLGRIVGAYNGRRFPAYFSMNFSLEKEIPMVFGKRMAVRIGVNNIFNHFNPSYVDGNVDSPTFLRFSDTTPRAFVGRVRLLKK